MKTDFYSLSVEDTLLRGCLAHYAACDQWLTSSYQISLSIHHERQFLRECRYSLDGQKHAGSGDSSVLKAQESREIIYYRLRRLSEP